MNCKVLRYEKGLPKQPFSRIVIYPFNFYRFTHIQTRKLCILSRKLPAAFRVCICRGRRHLIMPRLSLLAEGSAPVPFKPFNDCLLSLKGGANFKGKVTPAIEKSKKIKPQNPWKGLFPRILAVFHCINSTMHTPIL